VKTTTYTVVLLMVAICIAGCAPAVTPGVTVLTFASPYAPTHPFSRADISWIKWIEQESKGTLRIQPYWSGSVLSSEHSMDELRHGVADIGLITPIYARGGTHLIRVQAGFYAGLTTFEQQVALYQCMVAFDPQFDHELHDLVILAVQGGNLPGIVTRERAINSLKDLDGLRIRAPVELLGVLKRFGADPVDMPMGEVYSALAKGVLDGVVAPPDALRSLHFGEVAKHFNTIAIPRGAYAARAMGLKRWNLLSAVQQDLLRRGEHVWEEALARELKKANDAGERAAREQHMEFATMSLAEQERFLATYNQLAEQNATLLARFNIQGLNTYHYARKLAEQMKNGTAGCQIHDASTPTDKPTTTSPLDNSLNHTNSLNTSGLRDIADAPLAGRNIHG